MVKQKTTEHEPVITKAPEDTARFRDVAITVARKKVNIGTPEERVMSFLVEIALDPETGDVLPAKYIPTEGIADAIHQFKVTAAKKIFKL